MYFRMSEDIVANFFSASNPTFLNSRHSFHAASIIANLAIDQEGSRFLQKRIKLGTDEERHLALEQVLPHLTLLWQDVSGNYVLQQLLEHGDEEVRNELMSGVEKEGVVTLSVHMHG